MQLYVLSFTLQSVKNFHQREHTYTLHKQARSYFTRNATYVAKIDAQWHTDLADIQNYFRRTYDIKCFIIVIDVYFMFACAIEVNSKDTKIITAVNAQMLQTLNSRHF